MAHPPRSAASHQPITELLEAVERGEENASDRLAEVVYDELRRLAWGQLRREGQGCTLSPTTLVHELYLRFAARRKVSCGSRTAFFAAAAEEMRHVLVSVARKRKARKRGGRRVTVLLNERLDPAAPKQDLDTILDIDRALKDLEHIDPRLVEVVNLRCFAGCTIQEAAEYLDVSPATIKRDWELAKRYLKHHPTGESWTTSVGTP